MSICPHSVLFYTSWSNLNSVIQNVQKKIRNDSLFSFYLTQSNLVQSKQCQSDSRRRGKQSFYFSYIHVILLDLVQSEQHSNPNKK